MGSVAGGATGISGIDRGMEFYEAENGAKVVTLCPVGKK